MANYRVIGADGREYGPVSPELLRDWIAAGRVSAATRVCVLGSLDWRTLGTLPEFRGFVSSGIPLSARRVPAYSGYRQTNGWAISAFICGVLSIVLGFCCCCCLPLDLFGIVFSAIALVQIGRNPENQSGTALAVTGLILCLLSFLISFVVSALWVASGAGGEFMQEMERELRFGEGWFLSQ